MAPNRYPDVQWTSDELLVAHAMIKEIFPDLLEFPHLSSPQDALKGIVHGLHGEHLEFWRNTNFYPPPKKTRQQKWKETPIEKRVSTAFSVYLYQIKENKECPFAFSGFTWEQLKAHIESQFEDWMTWDNWGSWEIDHIIPRRLYLKPFSKDEIFGLKNLRPLSRTENRKKGRKYVQ